METDRVECWDVLRGMLIILVVVGHSVQNGNLAHDIIFLFHMPLFFVLSGALLKREKITDAGYLKHRAAKLLIPYICYLLIDWLLVRREFSLLFLVRLLWGGRALSGTYWYITSFITALFLFCFLLKHFNDRTAKRLIFIGGVLQLLNLTSLSV